MPAGLRCAGKDVCALAQQNGRDARLTRDEIQPAAGDKIKRFGLAGNLQQQRAHMRTGENVAGRSQGIGRIGGSYKKEIFRPAAQLRQALRMQCAIFQRFVIRPYPE
jgi:hypothetical protein